MVLHRGDLDKLVGTKARHPVCRLAIFEMQDQKLVLISSVDALNQYCCNIVVSPEHFLVTTPCSFYLVRSDVKWLTEIATTKACQALKENFSKDS